LLDPNLPRQTLQGPQALAQNHKQRNRYKPQITNYHRTTFSWHPNGCQDLKNQSIQKISTNPKNFANLKIPPTKHKKKTQQIWLIKRKPKPKFYSQDLLFGLFLCRFGYARLAGLVSLATVGGDGGCGCDGDGEVHDGT